MARAVTIGNGNLLVGFDNRGQVRDFYYPFVGHANHVSGASGNYVHRVGVFVDGKMSWLDDPAWQITIGADEDKAIGNLFATNNEIGVSLASRDAVHNEENIFLRHFTVHNNRAESREVKLFLAQQFRISESRRGDTAFFDPRVKAIIHYKGHQTFLINAMCGKEQFSDYNIGLFGIEGKEGTFLDAVDGKLENNPIEHGSCDSVIGLTATIAPQSSCDFHYWIVCAKTIPEAHTLDEHVLKETPDRLIASTEAYWQAWLEKESRDLSIIPKELQILYKRSMIILRVHTDNRGGVIASCDTDMLHHGRDTYSYVWPRDASIIAHAFDVTGYRDVSKRYFEFMAKCLEPGGYLMHKYRSDGVLGSSWHPWLQSGKPRLPIQEDETATTVVALWRHYEKYHDLEFIESLYNSFIEPAGEFMVEYIEPSTGLPQASYDLWEEQYGTSTYTACSVYASLMACSRFAALLGKEDDSRTFQAVAERMQRAIGDVLYQEDLGMFVKGVRHNEDGELEFDRTLDSSSFYGPVFFDVFDIDDERISKSLRTIEGKLQVAGASKGFIRYESDGYYRMQDSDSPNPWVITTLWVAQYLIKRANTLEALRRPMELLEWTSSHAAPGGVLSEQMHPHTREHLSTSPLVWSHAEYILSINAYVSKVEELSKEKA